MNPQTGKKQSVFLFLGEEQTNDYYAYNEYRDQYNSKPNPRTQIVNGLREADETLFSDVK
jgi:hypothetical protein